MCELVERALLRMDGQDIDEDYCLRLDIIDTGSWAVKFRRNCVIVNNRELIFNECLNYDASIKFKTQGYFWSTISGVTRLEDGLAKEAITQEGDMNCLNIFYKQLFSADLFTQTTGGKRRNSSTVNGSTTPIKSGWLLKKRDIINGWRSRYFVLYSGRLEYFVDQHDVKTRGIISLLGARLLDIQRTSVHGKKDYYCLVIENKYGTEKTTRVASELHADAGFTDITSWKNAFEIACHNKSKRAHVPILWSSSTAVEAPSSPSRGAEGGKDKPFLSLVSSFGRKAIKTFKLKSSPVPLAAAGTQQSFKTPPSKSTTPASALTTNSSGCVSSSGVSGARYESPDDESALDRLRPHLQLISAVMVVVLAFGIFVFGR